MSAISSVNKVKVKLMKELQRELSECLTQAGLQGKKGPAELPSRSWRHSQGLEEEDQALEVRQQHRQSQLGRRRTHSRERSGSSWHQSPSPSPPRTHPADKQLHCSLENLELQPKSQESKDKAQWCDTSPPKEEKTRKQVCIKADDELGEELDLSSDLAHFLVGMQPQSDGMLPVHLLGCPHLPKALSTDLPWQGEHGQKFWQQLSPINPAHGPGQGWEERGQTPLGIPAIGLQRR